MYWREYLNKNQLQAIQMGFNLYINNLNFPHQ